MIKSLTLKTSVPYNFITPGFKHGNECHRSSEIQIARLLKQLSVKQRQQRTKVSGWIVYVAGRKKMENGAEERAPSLVISPNPQLLSLFPFLPHPTPFEACHAGRLADDGINNNMPHLIS